MINCLLKLNSAVRFALADEIILFVKILKKLGKADFLARLKSEFKSWFEEEVIDKVKENRFAGYLKEQTNPFNTSNLSMSQKHNHS